MKAALFDFCGTLVDVQTVPRYVDWLEKRYASGHIAGSAIYCDRIWTHPSRRFERQTLRLAISQDWDGDVEKFVEEVLFASMREDVWERLRERMGDGCGIVVVSAAYECVLRRFFEKAGVVPLAIMGTRLEMQDGKASGRIQGRRCAGFEKVRRLKEWELMHKGKVDYVAAYSDSLEDAPLLFQARERYYVGHAQGVASVLGWRSI